MNEAPLDRLGEDQQALVRLAREIAVAMNVRLWLVGGPVRDLLRQNRPRDLDFAVQTRMPEFAAALAARLGAETQLHPRFLTARIVRPHGEAVDVATTRREIYPSPGALPTVEPAGIEEDLRRRDFTINAMAIDLLDSTVVDPAGGMSDSRDGLIRVMHGRSFADDPTRILRALRFAARFSFRLEEETQTLFVEALRADALRTISAERFWREIAFATKEPAPARVFTLGLDLGLLPAMLPGAEPDREPAPGRTEAAGPRALLESLDRISLAGEADRLVLVLAALLEGSDPDPILATAPFPARRKRQIADLVRRSAGFADELLTSDPRRRLAVARPENREMIFFAQAHRPELRPVVEWLFRYREQKLGFGGKDLRAGSGPHVARALERTREALFLGEIDPDEALPFAQARAVEYLNQTG